MQLDEFLQAVGHEVNDAEEEAFDLFSQEIPSQNLGFIDSRASSIEVTIHGRDFEIHQSPTVLSSARAGGTTGAVMWKITPLVAGWLSSPDNKLWTHSILNSESCAVELGCGVSGLVALSLAPSIGHYIATDQEYVHKLLKENIESNQTVSQSAQQKRKGHHAGRSRQSRKQTSKQQQYSPSPSRSSSRAAESDGPQGTGNIVFASLDWELDSPSTLKNVLTDPTQGTSHSPQRPIRSSPKNAKDVTGDLGFDLLLACDCIYNDALIQPFVQTCADICRLRPGYMPQASQRHDEEDPTSPGNRPTVCVVAQQLRAHDVFEGWLRESLAEFHVWRVRDEVLQDGLKSGSGYVVHVLVLRGSK